MHTLFAFIGAAVVVGLLIYGLVKLSREISIQNRKDKERE